MAKRKSRRIAPSSAYIGSGNRTSTFSQTPKKAFESVAYLYKGELKKDDKDDYRKAFKKLSDLEKAQIRQKIIQQKKAETIRKVVVLISSLVVLGLLILAFLYIFKKYCC
jgi:hypothetical protein